jgi:hypothetical protein
MLQISRADVVAVPFPHVVKRGILPQRLFDQLRADFPSAEHFQDQYASTGSEGSRVRAGKGFDIYRGDAAYDELIARSAAWASFDSYINSSAFVQTFSEVFGPDLDALSCAINVQPAAYDRSEVEGRETLVPRSSLHERIRAFLSAFRPRRRSTPRLFTRLDIERSTKGYSKPPHCDHENRLCSLILYFTDMEAEGIEGGELNIYRHRRKKNPSAHERHPKRDDVEVVATLKPEANLGVFFPCSNNSYHGVNAITTPGKKRDFLYINISAVAASCW